MHPFKGGSRVISKLIIIIAAAQSVLQPSKCISLKEAHSANRLDHCSTSRFFSPGSVVAEPASKCPCFFPLPMKHDIPIRRSFIPLGGSLSQLHIPTLQDTVPTGTCPLAPKIQPRAEQPDRRSSKGTCNNQASQSGLTS